MVVKVVSGSIVFIRCCLQGQNCIIFVGITIMNDLGKHHSEVVFHPASIATDGIS
jgi:hypothetical protein